jgi:streptomycin 6-kinase
VAELSAFEPWLTRWRLTADGEPFVTHHSRSQLLPVVRDGGPAMLKIAFAPEELAGGALMEWWDGDGAARVLARDGGVILLERAVGRHSLAEMAGGGQDDEASRILCAALDRLHAPRAAPPPTSLVPLRVWFGALAPAAAAHGGVLVQSLAASRALIDEPRDGAVLHGDPHHGNVLDGGPRGWLAIDPKGILGERGFDHAHILCNPDPETAVAPGRLARQVAVIAKAADLDPLRLLGWILAYAGLSAAWTIGEGRFDPAPALQIAKIAAAELA